MIRFQGDNSLIYFPGRHVTMEEVRQLKLIRPGVNDERIVMDVGEIDCNEIKIVEDPFEDQLIENEGHDARMIWAHGTLSIYAYAKFLDGDIIVIGDEGSLNSFVTIGKDLGWASRDFGNERGLMWSIRSAQDFDYKRLLARWEELGKPTEVHASELLGVPRPRRSLRTLQPL